MVALSRFSMSDLAGQKRVDVDLTADGDLSPTHTVSQAVDVFKRRMEISDGGVRWSAFARGVMLDGKSRLGDLPEPEVTVMPEVAAG